jgi:hypothetical protein
MHFYVRRHAKRKMKRREFTEEGVWRVLMSPEVVEDSVKDGKNMRAVVGSRVFPVTIKEERTRTIVVTLIEKTS